MFHHSPCGYQAAAELDLMLKMDTSERINNIRDRLLELKTRDKKRRIFGSETHKYELNPKLSNEEVRAFEFDYSITLPEGYREFLTILGNGGAGPYYGLETMQDSLYCDLDNKRPDDLLNPSIAFPFDESWNMEFIGNPDDDSEYEKYTNIYYSEKWETGLLRICNYGCGVSLNLIVKGNEKGNIWVDDRGNDGGIYPDPYFDQTGKTDFLEWYSLWLGRSLAELEN